jgi:uncharacterized membrane protein
MIAAVSRMVETKLILVLALLLVMSLLEGLLWFAPAVMAHQPMSAKDAIKWSVYAFAANVMPLTVFGIILTLLAFVATIPMFLGFVVLLPIYAICHFTSYQSMFRTDANQQSKTDNRDDDSPKADGTDGGTGGGTTPK